MSKIKIEINKKGEVRLEDQAQWVAATSGRVLSAEVRQTQQILRRHMTQKGNLLMTPKTPGKIMYRASINHLYF